MKKLVKNLAISFVLLAIVTFVLPTIIFAQIAPWLDSNAPLPDPPAGTESGTEPGGVPPWVDSNAPLPDLPPDDMIMIVPPPPPPGTESGTEPGGVPQVPQPEPVADTGECGLFNLGQCVADGVGYVVRGIIKLFATIFDYTAIPAFRIMIKASIVNFETYVNDGVKAGWRIGRNLANIVFVFALLYIAIKTILGLAGGELKRMLTTIIVVALLVNFSFVIALEIIRLSNSVALAFYNSDQFTNFSANLAKTFGNGPVETDKKAVKTSVEESSTVQQINDPESLTKRPGSVSWIAQVGRYLLQLILTIIMFLVAIFALLAAGVLFLIRIVVLLIVLILAPLAFAANIIPKYSSYASEWWNKLISQSFFAPACLFLFVVVSEISKALGNDPSQNLSTIIINFFILVALLIGSLIVAQKMGAAGATGAINLGNKLKGAALGYAGSAAGGATFGVAGRVGRGVLGGLVGRRLLQSEKMKEAAAGQGLKGRLAMLGLMTGKKMATSSYDLRATKLGANFPLGTAGGQGGREGAIERAARAKAKRADLLKPGVDERARLSKEQEDLQKKHPDADASQIKQYEQDLASKKAALAAAQAQGNATLVTKLSGELEKLTERLDAATQIRTIQLKIGGIPRQQKYATRLKGGFLSSRTAAEMIEKNISKEKPERLLEQLISGLKETGEKEKGKT